MNILKYSSIFVLFCLPLYGYAQTEPDYDLWDKALNQYVAANGDVHYSKLVENPEALTMFLNELVRTQADFRWPQDKAMTYWINAYNAYTLKLIADHWPVKSIKDIPSPWDKKFIPHGRSLISLNDIEHEKLRKMGDPRIHFAINCASASCPKLQPKAFRSQTLDAELNAATEEFLNDRTRNNLKANPPQISKIFDWFKADFGSAEELNQFLSKHSGNTIPAETKVKYLPYDWSLNGK